LKNIFSAMATPPLGASASGLDGSMCDTGNWAPNCSLAVSENGRNELFSNDEFVLQMTSVALYEAIANPEQDEAVKSAFDAIFRTFGRKVGSTEESVSFAKVVKLMTVPDAALVTDLRDASVYLQLAEFAVLVREVAAVKARTA
jgi:hypothetical protein